MPRSSGRRTGFSLIELLIVIGIVALLMAILLPTLGRVRRQAQSIKCMSNLRQLGTAMVAYATDNAGFYPRAAAAGSKPDDWIYWEPARASTRNYGAVVRYLGGRAFVEDHYRCPADETEEHPGYPYSYTMNETMGGLVDVASGTLHVRIRMSDVRRPAEKILVADESSKTVDDGAWVPANFVADGQNVLSNRHDRMAENKTDSNAGVGNVIFADGHASTIERVRSLDPYYYDALKR